jgi:hypothetical protein
MMTIMRLLFLWGLICASSVTFSATLAPDSLAPTTSIPQVNNFLVGLNLEFLVPDSLEGLSLPQTLTGAHLGLVLGEDTLELTAFYNSNPETSSLILSELNYKFNLSTPFITGYALTGLHYLHFRLAFQNKDWVGPVLGFGFDLPMARNFKMGLQMKLYYPKKTMLGFGGGFSFLF